MPKGLRTLAFRFDDPALTHFGGLVLLQRFCQQLRLRWLLQRDVLPPQGSGAFQPADLLLALIYVLVAGLKRVSKTQVLQYDGAFISLLGMDRFPDPSSLRRFLQRLSPQTIRQLVRLHDRLRAALGQQQQRSTLLFDLDSVVLTLYGRQQGAHLGYNPKKKGRRSYHPLLCFESHGQEFGTARCDQATPAPTRESLDFWSVVRPSFPVAWRARGFDCERTGAFSAANSWLFSKKIAGVM
jgi:hypothetical protein